MKRNILLLFLACCIANVSAYANSDTTEATDPIDAITPSDDLNCSSFYIETAVAVFLDQYATDYVTAVAGGYRKYVKNGIHWDILKLRLNNYQLNVFDPFSLQFLTGIHYNSPHKISNKSIYVNGAIGCLTDFVYAGFTFEAGAGLNINRTLSLGIVCDGFFETDYAAGGIGLQLGIQF
jgi:hypothetical protein